MGKISREQKDTYASEMNLRTVHRKNAKDSVMQQTWSDAGLEDFDQPRYKSHFELVFCVWKSVTIPFEF